jgi:SAM-dependent methyltransferase
VSRARRIAVGLARPSSRPRYVSAAKHRLEDLRTGLSGRPAPGGCRACGSQRVSTREVSNASFSAKQLKVVVCQRCGHVGLPENTFDFKQVTVEQVATSAGRTGTADVPGREFKMASMAAGILRHDHLKVLVYGPGLSLDYLHIRKLPRVARVTIGDLMRVQSEADFIDTSRRATQKFDIVVACEVIEHFEYPRAEFSRLLSYVAPNGLLVCSTNIYDGGNLTRHKYIHHRGHASYYSPAALRSIARRNHVLLDFRLPHVATGYAGPRKRYVLMSRSRTVMDAVADYFGTHMFGPSEDPIKPD